MTDKSSTTINKRILDFISANKIATVCCSAENKPHCFNCFYSFLEEEGCIIFKSSEGAKHIKMLAENNLVAGTIISSEISMTKIEGVQFDGVIVEKNNMILKATKSYYLRYPFAIAVPGKIWVIELRTLKYTNTTNGIKHKENWEKIPGTLAK